MTGLAWLRAVEFCTGSRSWRSVIRDAGVHAIANPLINITLQGRHDPYPKRRGMTRVPELMAADHRRAPSRWTSADRGLDGAESRCLSAALDVSVGGKVVATKHWQCAVFINCAARSLPQGYAPGVKARSSMRACWVRIEGKS